MVLVCPYAVTVSAIVPYLQQINFPLRIFKGKLTLTELQIYYVYIFIVLLWDVLSAVSPREGIKTEINLTVINFC